MLAVIKKDEKILTISEKTYSFKKKDIAIRNANVDIQDDKIIVSGTEILTDWDFTLRELSLEELQQYRPHTLKPNPHFVYKWGCFGKKKSIRIWETDDINFPVYKVEPKISITLTKDYIIVNKE